MFMMLEFGDTHLFAIQVIRITVECLCCHLKEHEEGIFHFR
jgi:hypothetical protein